MVPFFGAVVSFCEVAPCPCAPLAPNMPIPSARKAPCSTERSNGGTFMECLLSTRALVEIIAHPVCMEPFPLSPEFADTVGVDVPGAIVSGIGVDRSVPISPHMQRPRHSRSGETTGLRVDVDHGPGARGALRVPGCDDIQESMVAALDIATTTHGKTVRLRLTRVVATQLIERIIAADIHVDRLAGVVGQHLAGGRLLDRELFRRRRSELGVDIVPARPTAAL